MKYVMIALCLLGCSEPATNHTSDNYKEILSGNYSVISFCYKNVEYLSRYNGGVVVAVDTLGKPVKCEEYK